ncbi:hypothetical protein TCDM_01251 [Trypanosoma cruzi Dm28c]|uniref:Leucine-rich repeat protein (LRRP) n=2 Tax=Trypanosoma cruzi TaxID=5693 RepID=V5DQX0_TRYCR|nr:hypothetical protein TCDM_01251 [Trypanosoma cruzi Dm28c]
MSGTTDTTHTVRVRGKGEGVKRGNKNIQTNTYTHTEREGEREKRIMDHISASTTITTEAIKKICVQLGYYRNPICNEKLYLHHKGFDSIEEDAFDPYTDVKVLWLEGNALTHISCGRDSMPRRKIKPQSEVSVEEPAPMLTANAGFSKSAQLESCKAKHVDCCGDWASPPPQVSVLADEEQANVTAHANKPFSAAAHDEATADAAANDGGDDRHTIASPIIAADGAGGNPMTPVPPTATNIEESKDVFQSLYPTLRQLFLHNNALREMPDLSGFQRLDTVNLSNNCIHSVRANCATFCARVAHFETALQEKAQALMANSKSMQNEVCARDARWKRTMQRNHRPSCGAEGNNNTNGNKINESNAGPDSTLPASHLEETPTTTIVQGVDNVEGRAVVVEREGDALHFDLEMWRQRLSAYADFCPHEPLEIAENGKLSDDVPSMCRNPCSSIRSLNLSANYLADAADIVQLLCFKNLTVLDLSNNQLSNGEAVLLIMERLPRLRSLKLSGNPLVRSLPRYRKMVLARCPGLLHLDDRPVFADERRLVMAWARGGDEAENKERLLMKEETDKQHIRRLEEFRALVNRSRYPDDGNSNNNNNNNNNTHATNDTNAASRTTSTITVGTSTRREERRNQGGTYSPANLSDDVDDDDVTSTETEEEEPHEDVHINNRIFHHTGENAISQDAIIPESQRADIERAPWNEFDRTRELSSNIQPQSRSQQRPPQYVAEVDEEDGDIYIPRTVS